MLKIYRLKLKQNSYEVTIHYKGVGVRVAFTDGNIYNGTPARCYERDPFKQRAIEASPMFKNKEIVIERTVEDKVAKAAPVSVRKSLKSRIGAPVKPVASNPTTPVAPKVEDPEPPTFPVAPKVEDPEPPTFEESQGETPVQETPDAGEGGGENEVTFGSLSEAIVSIMQKYGKEVRTKNEACKFLKEQGITAHIKKG